MTLTVGDTYWVTLLLSVPTAAFLVRLFMIQHDCGHRSAKADIAQQGSVRLPCRPTACAVPTAGRL